MNYPEPPPFADELSEESRERKIAERAYYLWLDAGSPAGSAVGDWLEAERLLHSEDGSTSESADGAAGR